MKYAPKIYAQAFLEALPAGEAGKPFIKRFLQVIEKNGDSARLDKIVEAIEELETKKQGGRMIHIELARNPELAKQFKFQSKDNVKVSVNPSLVAGVRITIDGEQQFDGSLIRKLNKIFS